jgi:hypothetical protein
VASANVPTAGSGFALQGNAYLSGTNAFLCTYNGSNSTSLAAWRTATGQETSPHGFALTANPCFAPTPIPAITVATESLAVVYRLLYGSAIFQAGLDLHTLYNISPGTSDLLRNAIPVPYSIGAINAQVLSNVVGPNHMTGGCTA